MKIYRFPALRWLWLAAWLCPSFLYGASCEPKFLKRISDRLGYLPESENYHVFCEDHFFIDKVVILAISGKRQAPRGGGDEDIDLDIAVVNVETEKLLAHKSYKDRLGGQGSVMNLELLTDGYQLAPKVKAFAVRANFRFGGVSESKLSLFLHRGKKIVEILNGFTPEIHFSNRFPSCELKTRSIERKLGISHQKTKGFYDLIVNEVLTDNDQREDASGQCDLVEINRETKTYHLKYDGLQYVIPPEMQNLDCRIC